MRIGIMLRAIEEKFGIGVYTQNIVENLLASGSDHEFVLFYKEEKHLGKYGHYPNVEEQVLKVSSKLLWDQVIVPRAAKKARLDVLFHTKFTVPFFTKCKTVMVIHGASWFVHPELYANKLDLAYINVVMPLYCRKADAIISNSNLTTNDFVRILKVPPEKIKTSYFGINPIFRPVSDSSLLEVVKRKYNLPDRFILTVSRYDPRKNFATIFGAFQKCDRSGDLKLLAVGKDSEKYREECGIIGSGLEDDVIFPGYVEQEDLPAFYNLAELFIFPSVYEEFGIPMLEAMACGCPIVAANSGALPEITAGAAFLADPFDVDGMARGIDQVIKNPEFKKDLVERGFERAKDFDWAKATRETLEVLESVVNSGSRG
jgi:glycosyltransferase involved in cell wall biosynthesis